MEMRFPGGVTYCEECKQERKHYRIKGRPVFSCAFCGTQVSPTAGTILEHSSTSLRLWFYAMYLMASTRCGISAKQIQRELGVTYKTAWRMLCAFPSPARGVYVCLCHRWLRKTT